MPGTNDRMVREPFLLVPEKHSKTTNGAAAMLTALLMNERPRGEFLLVGPTKEVASPAFNQAIGMIEANPEGCLPDRMHIQDHLKTITDRRTKAQLKIKTFDTSVLTGVKPVGVLLDELHEISGLADAERVIGQIRGGMVPNSDGFLAFITIQSARPPSGLFRAELMKAGMIRDGKLEGVTRQPAPSVHRSAGRTRQARREASGLGGGRHGAMPTDDLQRVISELYGATYHARTFGKMLTA